MKIALPIVSTVLVVLLLVGTILFGFFPINFDVSGNNYINIPYNKIEVTTIPVSNNPLDNELARVFKSFGSNYYDRIMVYAEIQTKTGDSALSNYLDTFQLKKIAIVYDLSQYNFNTLEEFSSYLTNGNMILLSDNNFISGYVLPFSLYANNISTDFDYEKWLPSKILERGEKVPYYSLVGIGSIGNVRYSNNAIQISYGQDLNSEWYLPLSIDMYDYFKGLVGSFGIMVDSVAIPVYNYDIDNLGDIWGLAKYTFTFLSSWGDWLRNIVSSLFYGFVPLYFTWG